MPADEPLKIGDGGGTKPLALHEVQANSTAVIEDQQHFLSVQRQRADAVKPPNFEECMASGYAMDPEPLPEASVAAVTQEASRALEQERNRAGGILPPADQIRMVPEAPDEVPGVVPGPPPAVAPNPAHLVDFYEVTRLLQELQKSLQGVNARVEAWETGAVPQVASPQGSSAKAVDPSGAGAPVVQVEAPPELPKKPGPPQKPQSIQERRAQRAAGGGPALPMVPSNTQDAPRDSEVASAAGTTESDEPQASPGGSRGWVMPSLRMPVPSFRVIGVAAGTLVAASILVVFLGRRRGEVSAESILVERQVQGVGAYVRAEEHNLTVSLHRGEAIEREIAQLRIDSATAQSDQDRRDLQRRLADAQKRLGRSSRAGSGLQALEEVSGIKVGHP